MASCHTVTRNPLTVKGNDRLQPDSFCGLPFTPSRWIDFVLPATLFLCAIFGKASDPTVLSLYNRMASNVVGARMDSQNSAFLNNCFRALVIHPDISLHEAAQAVVAWLAKQQTMKGNWGEDIPFFQTVNALSHLNSPESDAQCQKAINLLASTQNADGSWGKTEKEWSTFLVVHTLRNKPLL